MRKGIAIFGGSLFQDIKYTNGTYIPTLNQAAVKLAGNYEIDNYSLVGMNSERVKKYVTLLPMKKLYNHCILALGEAELEYPEAFEKNLNEIIDLLQKKCIRPLLVSLPKELMVSDKGMKIQEVLDTVAVNKNIDYIYEGNTTKLVSYKVIDDQDFTKAIMDLC